MESNPNAVNIYDIEQLYLSMFSKEGISKNRILILLKVYDHVRLHNGITLNKLQWTLKNVYSFPEDDVEIAVNALSNVSMFDAISKYHVNGKNKTSQKPIVHLRTKKDDEHSLISEWQEKVVNKYSEFKIILNS
jgi:hypothetical protein